MAQSCSLSETPRPVSVPTPGPSVRLTVRGTAQQCDTLEPVTLIGSRRDCRLSLHSPDVSKVHCAVIYTGHSFLVRDLCSRTGTLLNGRPIREAELKTGDRLTIGSRDVTVEVRGGMPPRSAGGEEPIQLGSHTFHLARGTVIVGRRASSDLVLDTPDVSYVHALLFDLDGQPTLHDLGSRSGTLVNGVRCTLASLKPGDRVSIGGVSLAVSCATRTEAARPAATVLPPADPPLTFAAALPPATIELDDRCAASPAAGAELVQALLADLVRERDALGRRAAELEHRAVELAATAERNDARSQELDRRTVDLQRWAVELETLKREIEQRAAELDRQATRLQTESDRVEERTAEVEQLAADAQDRLALALAHEQAVAAVLADLDQWTSTHEAALQRLRELGPRPRVVPGLPEPAPVLRPFAASPAPPAGRRVPSA